MKTTPITLNALLELIEEARNAELCRDTYSLREILQNVWSDFETAPDYSSFPAQLGAELLRLSGVFMAFHGFSQSLKNYQLKGKDLLTNAIEQYDQAGIPEKAAEAKINLAFCYWNLGEVKEAEIILEVVEEEFGKNLLHPVYLQIRVNRLLICFYKQDTNGALEIIQEIEPSMRFCGDVRLQGMFHTQAGIFCRADKQYEKAAFHLNEAIKFARKSNNGFYVAMNLNNLAFLYKEIKDFKKSFVCISKSIEETKRISHLGFLPHALDTKALIFLDWNKPEEALKSINEAIEVFNQGEDYRGLTESYWTKTKILRKLRRTQESFVVFADLIHIAREKIGETAVEKFSKLMDEAQPFHYGKSYDDLVENFQKSLVGDALQKSGGKIGEAAKTLGFQDHRRLSEMLRKQFPELREELGYERRAVRGSKKQQVSVKVKDLPPPRREITLYKKDIFNELEISPIDLLGKRMVFTFEAPAEQLETFYFDKHAMAQFGFSDGAVVVVAPASELRKGQFILVSRENDSYLVGKIDHDAEFNVHFLRDEIGEPFFPDEKDIIGEPVGYCPCSETDSNFIEFSRLKIK